MVKKTFGRKSSTAPKTETLETNDGFKIFKTKSAPPKPDTPDAPDAIEAAQVSVLDDDHRRNANIVQTVAKSIKSIIRDEVDETLDRIVRQAVRDALKAHRPH